MLNSIARITVLGLILALPRALLAGPRPSFVPEKPTAKEILERMRETYANCKAYQDTGVTKVTSEPGPRDGSVSATFSTAFMRPDRFRFEYRSEGHAEFPYILWQGHDDIRSTTHGDRKLESLVWSITHGTGAMGMEDKTIISLLLPKVTAAAYQEEYGREFKSLWLQPDARRIVDGYQGKTLCYRIRHGEETNSTLWIDQKTHLMRRIDVETVRVPNDGKRIPALSSLTTTYEPVIDEEIPEKDLQYNAPKREQSQIVFCTDGVLKVSVLKSGKILVDGQEMSLDGLDKRLGEFKKAAGRSVWFYSEARKQREQPMERWRAQQLVCEKHRLGITGFQKPDFSDHPEIKRMTQKELDEFDRKSQEEPEKMFEASDIPASAPTEP